MNLKTNNKNTSKPVDSTALVPDLLKPSEAAAKLGISVSGLNALGLPRIRLGYRTIRYAPQDVVTLLNQRKGGAR